MKSEKGIGTEFEVVLSLGNANSKNVNHTNAIDPANFYILVVDDDPIEAEHARIVLEEIGIAADTRPSGLRSNIYISARCASCGAFCFVGNSEEFPMK